MKNFTKIASTFGGLALLAAGCGQDGVVGVTGVEDISTGKSAIVLQSSNNTTDAILGYYDGCQGHDPASAWSVLIGGYSSTTNSPLLVTKGDTGCSLWVTGIKAAERTGASVSTTAISTYLFYSPTDNSSPAPIALKTNTVANPFYAANVALARKADVTDPLHPVVDESGATGESVMANVGAINMTGFSGGTTTGTLNFQNHFKIMLRTGSAADLGTTDTDASFIGYAAVTAAESDSWLAPNYTATKAGHNAVFKTDGQNHLIVADGYFKFNKSSISGTEFAVGTPGAVLTDGTNGLSQADFAALSDTRKFEVIMKNYNQWASYSGPTTINQSATTVSIPASTLYPLDTNLSAPTMGNADLKDNVVIFQRKDAASGVTSYQAFLIHLNLI